ncbi:Retrotransposon-like protein [Dorcoceras hygrometricum]|nr:Retrotransposon-like protein [Dorcoceras hygrometricum]
MSVREYARRFSSLLAYVPHVAGRERAKRTKFIEGLSEELYTLVLSSKPKSYAEAVDSAIDIEEGLRNRRSRARPQGAQGGRLAVQGAQSSQSSQSTHQPQQQPHQQLSQQSGRQRFRPRGQQFKNKSGSGSSGSGSSSSSGSRADFCGGKHLSTQCVGVQGSCNICGQYGHFASVCPSAGSRQAVAPPQGRGGQSRGRSPQFPQPRVGEMQFRPFQLPGPSRFGQSSQQFFSGPQHAQANAITKEQAEETPSRVIAGTCLVFDFPARLLFDTGASHSFISDAFVIEHGLHTISLRDVMSVSTPGDVSLFSQEVLLDGVLRFGEHVLVANLIRLMLWDFECIVGMDVLSNYRASVDCFHGIVRFRPQSEEKWDFYGHDSRSEILLVSAMYMFSLLSAENSGFCWDCVGGSGSHFPGHSGKTKISRKVFNTFKEIYKHT